MSFPWIEYLTLAEALVQARGTFAHDAACCRAAISRAYYATYCAARNHARNGEGLVLHQTSGDHQRVILHYRRTANRSHQEIAELLFRLGPVPRRWSRAPSWRRAFSSGRRAGAGSSPCRVG